MLLARGIREGLRVPSQQESRDCLAHKLDCQLAHKIDCQAAILVSVVVKDKFDAPINDVDLSSAKPLSKLLRKRVLKERI